MGASHVYGLAERGGGGHGLHDTTGGGTPEDCVLDHRGGGGGTTTRQSEPYRLYNLDVFGYETDAKSAWHPLYGAVPLLLSVGDGLSAGESRAAGVLWLNPSETFVDVETVNGGRDKSTHWYSETGVVDLFLMADKSPPQVQRMYTRLSGRQFMPPMFALGYHQCRWNYKDEADVREVDSSNP